MFGLRKISEKKQIVIKLNSTHKTLYTAIGSDLAKSTIPQNPKKDTQLKANLASGGDRGDWGVGAGVRASRRLGFLPLELAPLTGGRRYLGACGVVGRVGLRWSGGNCVCFGPNKNPWNTESLHL